MEQLTTFRTYDADRHFDVADERIELPCRLPVLILDAVDFVLAGIRYLPPVMLLNLETRQV